MFWLAVSPGKQDFQAPPTVLESVRALIPAFIMMRTTAVSMVEPTTALVSQTTTTRL